MRLARKCSFKVDFDIAISRLCKVLVTQGYNSRFLRNIKYDVLFSTGFYITKSISFGFHPCNCSDCFICPKALFSKFAFDNNFQQFRILSYINCKSKHIVFSVYCSICGPIYVSFSNSSLESTYKNILNIILHKPDYLLSIHFHQASHTPDNFFIQGLEIVNLNYHHKLLKWIFRLRTYVPPGINTYFYKPFITRLNIPFSNSNRLLFNYIKRRIFHRFNVKLFPAYSTYPNLKRILCKSKL